MNNYAGFWRRLLAWAVDSGIEALLIWGLALSFGINPFKTEQPQNIQYTIYQVLSFVIVAVYTLLFWVNYDGATPGKKLLDIKVVHGNNKKPLNYGVAVIRYLGYLISLLPLGLGYLWVAFDGKKQGWHDKIADTYVVKTGNKPRTGLAVFILFLEIIVFFVMMGISLKTAFQSPEFKQSTEQAKRQITANRTYEPQTGDTTKILSFAPSNCGLSIPVPKTEDKKDGKQRKWIYEELVVDKGYENQYFYVLDSDTYSPANVLFSNVSYKGQDQLLGKKESSLAFPGLNVYCSDNYKNLTLDEFKSLALLNKQLTVTEEGKAKWGDVEVVSIHTQGTMSDGFKLQEPGYIAVSKDGKKLLYMRFWSPDLKDPIYDNLSKDVDLIIRNLKLR